MQRRLRSYDLPRSVPAIFGGGIDYLANMMVHTAARLLPREKYGKAHPDLFEETTDSEDATCSTTFTNTRITRTRCKSLIPTGRTKTQRNSNASFLLHCAFRADKACFLPKVGAKLPRTAKCTAMPIIARGWTACSECVKACEHGSVPPPYVMLTWSMQDPASRWPFCESRGPRH